VYPGSDRHRGHGGTAAFASGIETDNLTITFDTSVLYSPTCVGTIGGPTTALDATACTGFQQTLLNRQYVSTAACSFASGDCACSVSLEVNAPTAPQAYTISGSRIVYASGSTPLGLLCLRNDANDSGCRAVCDVLQYGAQAVIAAGRVSIRGYGTQAADSSHANVSAPPSGVPTPWELGRSQVAARVAFEPSLHATTRPVLSDTEPVTATPPEPSLIVNAASTWDSTDNLGMFLYRIGDLTAIDAGLYYRQRGRIGSTLDCDPVRITEGRRTCDRVDLSCAFP